MKWKLWQGKITDQKLFKTRRQASIKIQRKIPLTYQQIALLSTTADSK